MDLVVGDLQRAICSLFKVHPDEGGVQRVVTPLEYGGSGDQIVVRVRPSLDGFQIDENGEAAFYASMSGGDVEAEVIDRWAESLQADGRPVEYGDDEVIRSFTADERLLPTNIFRVAEAAQQLYALATARLERQSSRFKELVREVILDVASKLQMPVKVDDELPIVGKFKADFVLGDKRPLIIITATSAARLLEAELITTKYRLENRPGAIVAVAESQAAVGRKHFERAGYYTDRAVVFDPDGLHQLVQQQITA